MFDSHHPPSPALIDQCVHCGFCLPACPTYVLWGQEMDSPRGRIYLMRLASDGKAAMTGEWVKHFDTCLGCMACMTACPSGVDYAKLIEATRGQIERKHTRSPANGCVRGDGVRHVSEARSPACAAMAVARVPEERHRRMVAAIRRAPVPAGVPAGDGVADAAAHPPRGTAGVHARRGRRAPARRPAARAACSGSSCRVSTPRPRACSRRKGTTSWRRPSSRAAVRC